MNKIKVLQFQGLAPSVFCGQYFSDIGCDVVIIARHSEPTFGVPINENLMNRNKKCICLSLKSNNDIQIIKQLLKQTDIVIDSFRPGVLEKVGLGYKDMYNVNQKIILLRVSGYGQEGNLSLLPGHDLNYIAVSGYLSQINSQGKPSFPNNYLADFVSASLGIMGVMIALNRRQSSGIGDMIDCSLMHGTKYLSSFLEENRQIDTQITKQQNKQWVSGRDANGSVSKIQIMKMQNLLNNEKPIDYQKQKFIMKSNNPFGYSIISPFLHSNQKGLPNISPFRGQHTLSYLQERNISKQLIQKSISPNSKL